MQTQTKVALWIVTAMVVAVFAVVVVFFAWLWISLDDDPIQGWQEGPHTPTATAS
ncbi:MAG TPA: hypothetical protein VH912_27570 [Streptosporangiaceae bacterium]|jgi:hypothetical protein